MLHLFAALALLGLQEYSDEALQSTRKLRVMAGLKAELFAAEPQFVNPVCLSIDDKGRLYVGETHRRHSSVFEVWDRREWLDGDLAARTVEDRVALYRKHLGAGADKLAVESERIRVLQDLGGKGRADYAETFAEGFNQLADGLGSSVLAVGNDVYYACAPNLWKLTVGPDGKAVSRKVLHTGFGVHMSSGAHDFHGLCQGPDGKIYMSMGDRGYHVVSGGRTFDSPDTGGVLRCNPDGSDLEVFATGLRNPEQMCFDALGNLWTGDNNCDAGDKARWVWVVEGGDSGWRFGYQREALKSPWMIEKLWALETATTAPSQVPAVGYMGHGPSGVAYNPGTGLNSAYREHFFMCDFPGGVRSFRVEAKGAGYGIVDEKEFFWELWPTDLKFGPDGALYVTDWVQGWAKPEKGRIFRIFDPANRAEETRRLLAEGMAGRAVKELHDLLSHADLRVRQGAQFELVVRKKTEVLASAAQGGSGYARLHGIWGLGQLRAVDVLQPLLRDPEAEIRAQAAKVLGDLRVSEGLIPLLKDAGPRVRLYAALGIARAPRKDAVGPLLDLLRENNDADPFLRHAGVYALAQIGDAGAVIAIAKDPSPSMRLASLLVLRRLERKEVELFVDDPDPRIVLEAARAIHDVPIPAAAPALIGLLKKPGLNERVCVRAMNAALRSGQLADLIAFAAEGPPADRAEAVEALGLWEQPPSRDRVLGLWRPVPARKLDLFSREILKKLLHDLIVAPGPEAVVVQALRAWGSLQLGICEGASRIFGASAIRVEALRTLAATQDAGLKVAVMSALEGKDALLREEAVKLLVQLRLPDTAGLLEKLAMEQGVLAVRQAAMVSLGDWAGPESDGVLARLLDQWKDLPAGLHLELLEAAGKRASAAVKEGLARVEAARVPNRELLEGGDAKAGREIFFDRLDVSCARCHAVKDKGGTVGPALTKVGAERTRDQILESILLPNKVIVQGYAQELFKMKSDTVEMGRVEKETDAEVLLVLADGQKKRLPKGEIQGRKVGLSAMPEDISKALNRRDLRDLVAYLATLQK